MQDEDLKPVIASIPVDAEKLIKELESVKSNSIAAAKAATAAEAAAIHAVNKVETNIAQVQGGLAVLEEKFDEHIGKPNVVVQIVSIIVRDMYWSLISSLGTGVVGSLARIAIAIAWTAVIGYVVVQYSDAGLYRFGNEVPQKNLEIVDPPRTEHIEPENNGSEK